MKRVGIFMMQKDEDDLLPIWIKYYSALFGPENINIFDNGSRSYFVRQVLRDAEANGVRVIYKYSLKIDFEKKGKVLANDFLLHQDKFDCFIPVDCDEFIAVETKSGWTCDAEAIKLELAGTIEGIGFSVSRRFQNCPWDPEIFYFHESKNPKLYFGKGKVKGLCTGFHSTKMPRIIIDSRIGIFEIHHKPLDLLKEHAKRKLESRVKSFEQDAIRNYKGRGKHLIPYLFMSEDTYLESFQQKRGIRTSALVNALSALKLKFPFTDLQPVIAYSNQ